MEIIVYYNSKTGFTKKYADWIADELGCGVFPYRNFKKSAIGENSIIIFGSRVHAGKIEYLNKVKNCFTDKRNIIVFVTGATPVSETAVIERMWESSLTNEEIKIIPHFYMQSGLNYEKMGLIDRTIMKIVAKLIGGKKNKSEAERKFDQAIKKSHDFSSKEYITPLVKFVKANISRNNE